MSGSGEPLSVRLERSWSLAALLALLHLGGGALIILLPVSLALRLAALALVLAGGWHGVRRHALRRGPKAVTALELPRGDEGSIVVHTAAGEQRCVIRGSYVQPFLVLLTLRCPGRRRGMPLVLPADCLAAESFRRLRVRLRQQAAAE